MTIKDRINKLNLKDTDTVYVKVFDNTTEWSPENVDFYLCDFEEYQECRALNYRLDTERRATSKGLRYVMLGFDGLHKGGTK